MVFGCGHSVCLECADAMQACVPAVCLVCRVPIAWRLANRGLGEFVGGAWGPPRAQTREGEADAALVPLLARFAAASARLGEAAHAVAGAKEELVSNALACFQAFNHSVDGLLVCVEEYRGRWLARAQLLAQEREKALEAQMDLLEVSAGQLEACVALGRAAVASGDGARVWEATRTAKATEGLLGVSTRLCTGTRMAVFCGLPAAWTRVEECTRVQHFEVDAARCCASGLGLATFATGAGAGNVIQVTCKDTHGWLAEWVTLEDVHVRMTVGGVDWEVASAVLTGPGVVQVTYVAEEEEGWEEVELGVSVCGVGVPGGPWRARVGFQANGVYIATLPLRVFEDQTTLAVSRDGGLMVTSNDHSHQLSVYRTEDGRHVRSFGREGEGLGRFSGIRGLCMTAHDTVLVAEENNKRIQEVTLGGAHVQCMAVESSPLGVAVYGDVVAVSTLECSVVLYSHTTGAVIRVIQVPNKPVCLPIINRGSLQANALLSVCFSPDGNHLAVGRRWGCITLVSVAGETMSHLGPKARYVGVAFTCTGDLVGPHQTGLGVYSARSGAFLRSLQATRRGDYDVPVSHFTVHRNRVYVLDYPNARVQIFE